METEEARFDKVFGEFIRRDEEKITPKTFFQVLAETERERVQKTVELRAKIIRRGKK
ncbi:MAG: hypothetical protein HYZ72_06785 [Deltaproteobacteria bacterium]|nr:hypothetical protein [Deltaproteobacteria bacterium]